MGLLVGFFLGAALGVGLIVCFARFQNNRSKARIDLVLFSNFLDLFSRWNWYFVFSCNNLMFLIFCQAKAIAAFARMTVQDSRKLLPPEAYPSWVVFSQKQKLSCISVTFLGLYIGVIKSIQFANNGCCISFLLIAVELA